MTEYYKEISATSMADLVLALNDFREYDPSQWVLIAVNNENHNWFAVLERKL